MEELKASSEDAHALSMSELDESPAQGGVVIGHQQI